MQCVINVARGWAAVTVSRANPWSDYQIMKSAVRLALGHDLGHPNGSELISRASYGLLEYWARKMDRDDR